MGGGKDEWKVAEKGCRERLSRFSCQVSSHLNYPAREARPIGWREKRDEGMLRK